MIVIAIIILGLPCVGLYFLLGRFICPRRERLPLNRMDSTALAQTITRGWNAIPVGPAASIGFTPVLPQR
ncbi:MULTISPECIES: hypothetical protein [Brevibacterium]|uniref:Uncharacterized protein n=1 Tax=Brevibacterium luteolum TaxID=199591 RepID=A0A2N6PGM1_9MICO|nr:MULTISPECIES: hypothetical protein [Brevibacterium]PMB97831.1 hypothetical protein CJ198_08320 [Brevibacterium luteolum]QIN29737.1 hypothetical protein EW640_10970 [Brevibacterium luteolum]